jgi:hypothetical protein
MENKEQILINPVQVANAIAHQRVEEQYKYNNNLIWQFSPDAEETKDYTQYYTPQVQEFYNVEYNKILDIITNFAIKEDSTINIGDTVTIKGGTKTFMVGRKGWLGVEIYDLAANQYIVPTVILQKINQENPF